MNEHAITERRDHQMTMTSPMGGGALASVEQSRAIAEVQASLVIAKANPRDEAMAERQILNACKRVTLANTAMFAFRRGGTLVTGPTIRLAEVLARAWGNMNYGYREVGRGRDYSEIEAYAHDLQSNTRVTRQFQVKHWRDKRGGGEALTQERDKYEYVASQAQRRVRACILEIIPGDIVEAATEACEATLKGNVGDIKEATGKILAAFEQLGVTKEDIERYMQRKLESLVPVDIVGLRKVHYSIKSGIASKEEFFKQDDAGKLNQMFAGKAEDAPKRDNQNGDKPKQEKKSAAKKSAPKQQSLTDPPPPKDDGPAESEMVACPEAGGMKILLSDCESSECSNGCKAFEAAKKK